MWLVRFDSSFVTVITDLVSQIFLCQVICLFIQWRLRLTVVLIHSIKKRIKSRVCLDIHCSIALWIIYYIMHGVRKSKTVLDSGFQELDSPADSLSVELRFQISIFSGIPDSLSWGFSGFQSPEFRIPLAKAKYGQLITSEKRSIFFTCTNCVSPVC